jgi:creatinine amidohydrolase
VTPQALADSTWTDVAPRRPVLVVPLGSVEQHGPHLPLDTDTRIATAVAVEVAAQLARAEVAPADIVVAPAIAYGASGEHAGFAGTLSIGQDALERTAVELVRSADHFAGVVLVNGHGGNGAALRRAVERLREEGRRVLLAHCGMTGGDAHAGRTETSVLLHLAPEVVHLDRAEPGDVRPWSEIAADVRAGGVAAVSANGVLGDPIGSSAREGADLFTAICARVAGEVAGWADV